MMSKISGEASIREVFFDYRDILGAADLRKRVFPKRQGLRHHRSAHFDGRGFVHGAAELGGDDAGAFDMGARAARQRDSAIVRGMDRSVQIGGRQPRLFHAPKEALRIEQFVAALFLRLRQRLGVARDVGRNVMTAAGCRFVGRRPRVRIGGADKTQA